MVEPRLGQKPAQFEAEGRPSYKTEESMERINALAKALGIPSKDLAVAIASGVRQYASPESLSSVAAKESPRVDRS